MFCFVFPLRLQPVMEFSAQVNAMQHLKEQLEQRTRMIQANIQRQQEELRHIQEQLQRVQGQGIQVLCNIKSNLFLQWVFKSSLLNVSFLILVHLCLQCVRLQLVFTAK